MRSEKGAKRLLIAYLIIGAIIMTVMATSCCRSITPFQAANGKAKCGRWLK